MEQGKGRPIRLGAGVIPTIHAERERHREERNYLAVWWAKNANQPQDCQCACVYVYACVCVSADVLEPEAHRAPFSMLINSMPTVP